MLAKAWKAMHLKESNFCVIAIDESKKMLREHKTKGTKCNKNWERSVLFCRWLPSRRSRKKAEKMLQVGSSDCFAQVSAPLWWSSVEKSSSCVCTSYYSITNKQFCGCKHPVKKWKLRRDIVEGVRHTTDTTSAALSISTDGTGQGHLSVVLN